MFSSTKVENFKWTDKTDSQPTSWTVYGVNYGVTCFCAERNVTLRYPCICVLCAALVELPMEFIYLRYVCALQLDCLFIVPFSQVERRRGRNNCHSARKPLEDNATGDWPVGQSGFAHLFFGHYLCNTAGTTFASLILIFK